MDVRQINAFMEEIDHLKEGQELLESVWSELGPYTNSLSNELRAKLQNYFGFDDSE